MRCPGCNEEMEPAVVQDRRGRPAPVWRCLRCDRELARRPDVLQPKLPGLDPGRQAVQVDEPEEPVMQRMIRALRGSGYIVLCTVHRYKMQQCSRCKTWNRPKGGYGATKGIGDLLVGIPRGAPRLWVMGDAKTRTGPLTEEQAVYAAMGLLRPWRHEDEALADCAELERALLAPEAGARGERAA